jgi:hypothetical protein
MMSWFSTSVGVHNFDTLVSDKAIPYLDSYTLLVRLGFMYSWTVGIVRESPLCRALRRIADALGRTFNLL